MSRSAVTAYVRAACAAITGVAQCTIGWPPNHLLSEAALPWVIISAPQPRWTDLTYFGAGAGSQMTQYPVHITVVMGPANMPPADAEAARELWSDRVRGAVCADHTMAGAVLHSTLSDGTDNVDTYWQTPTEAQPLCTFTLTVTEIRTYTAVVA